LKTDSRKKETENEITQSNILIG